MCQNGLLFEAEYYCIVWLGLVFFLHSPVSLGGFPLMATGNSAAVNRSVPVGVLCRSASNLLPEAPLQPLWETHIRGLKNPPPPQEDSLPFIKWFSYYLDNRTTLYLC